MNAAFKFAIASACILLSSVTGQAADMFGIVLGDDVAKYRIAGPAVSERHELRMFELAPPSPDSRFDTYAVDTHRGRIVRIMASSADDGTPDAEQTLAILRELRHALVERYGQPSLMVGEIEDAGNELRDHLVDEGGLEVLEWDFVQAGPDDLGAVYVFLAGAVDERGAGATYCTLYMESPDYAELSEEARLHEESAPSPTPAM